MCNICGDNDNLSVVEMYMDKTTCDQLLWWDSTMKGGSLVRDCDTFTKKKFKRFQDMEETEIYNKLTRLQQEGTKEEYLRNILVLATYV